MQWGTVVVNRLPILTDVVLFGVVMGRICAPLYYQEMVFRQPNVVFGQASQSCNVVFWDLQNELVRVEWINKMVLLTSEFGA